jgi:archaellum biogenesis protein FlaJ (TadC family)
MTEEKNSVDNDLNFTLFKMQKITTNHVNAESKLRELLAKKKSFNNESSNDEGPSL